MREAKRQTFLYGDISHTFGEITTPFVEAAAAQGSTIALLLQGGHDWRTFVTRYTTPWSRHADIDVVPIVPGHDGLVDSAGQRAIEVAGGIFMGGGDVPTYHQAFAAPRIAASIRATTALGIPYGGVSAGAMLAASHTILDGNAVDGRRLNALDSTRLEEISLGDGIGVLDDVLVEPHFTEFGGFPRLHAGMTRSKARMGIGIDEPAGIAVEGEDAVVIGHGAVHVLRRNGTTIEAEAFVPGDQFALPAPALPAHGAPHPYPDP